MINSLCFPSWVGVAKVWKVIVEFKFPSFHIQKHIAAFIDQLTNLLNWFQNIIFKMFTDLIFHIIHMQSPNVLVNKDTFCTMGPCYANLLHVYKVI